jgi:hypothetical protein
MTNINNFTVNNNVFKNISTGGSGWNFIMDNAQSSSFEYNDIVSPVSTSSCTQYINSSDVIRRSNTYYQVTDKRFADDLSDVVAGSDPTINYGDYTTVLDRYTNSPVAKTITNVVATERSFNSGLVLNGDFESGTDDWAPNSGVTTLNAEDGKMKVSVSGAASGYALQNIIPVTSGLTYRVRVNGYFGTSSDLRVYTPNGGWNNITSDGELLEFTFTASSGQEALRLYVFGDGLDGYFDNVSCFEQ